MTIVSIGGFAVLILLILRQFLALYQIDVLQRKLRKRNRSLDLLNAQLEQQATTDPLTNLPNHRALAEKLDEALAQAQVKRVPCSVVFMDIDHFKILNDTYGHLVGDQALGSFARIVIDTVRPGDAVGRWGGEEFVAILPSTCAREAFEVAERIRGAISQHGPLCQGAPELTCSLGVATYPQDASGRTDLIQRADQAMYTAKRLGRNQTRSSRESLVSAKQRPVHDTKASAVEMARALLVLLEARDPA